MSTEADLYPKAPLTFGNPPLTGVDPWAEDQLTWSREGNAISYHLRGVLLERLPATLTSHNVRVMRAIRRFDQRLNDLYVAQRIWAHRKEEPVNG